VKVPLTFLFNPALDRIGNQRCSDGFSWPQGDPWDTQWDMFLAFCRAIMAMVTLSALHNGSMQAVEMQTPSE